MDWEKAIDHLNLCIEDYESAGWTARFALNLTLYPLKRRVNAGERTQELYDEIMEVK